MNEKKYFYEKNTYLVESPLNITFGELLQYSENQITEWVDKVRSEVIRVWDTYGNPPARGKDEGDIIDNFNKMSAVITKKFSVVDELTGEKNVILNPTPLGAEVNQWFPTQMAAKINYNTSRKDDSFSGKSMYDYFKDPEYRDSMQTGFRRHFRKDSFYKYSICIEAMSKDGLVPAKSGTQWIDFFRNNIAIFRDYDFWISEAIEGNSGYVDIKDKKFLYLTKNEVLKLYACQVKKQKNVTNLDLKNLKDDAKYYIRFYKKKERIFPGGFQAFKIGYIQVAVNFPPMIAKYLYEKYTEHIKTQEVINIYDPSCGWGGRILGAMSVSDDRHIHYIGTDPNTDNFIDDLGITRYEHVANFFNTKTYRSGFFSHTNTFDVYTLGSEVISREAGFKRYKGNIDFVFTSPPYFNREGYSDDPTQSLNKFPQYDAWVKGFLKPTLKTCVEWLKPNRYLAWNVADILVGKNYYPIEQDSKKILKELGMEYVGVEKMALMSMPGANRIGEDGKPTAKNFVKVKGQYRKVEPIFIFRKP